MRALLVLDFVLDELEAGQADAVERDVVGAAGVALGDGRDAEVLERLDPGCEDRRDGVILLRVDAADLAGAVVEVEVGGEFGVLRLDRQRSGVARIVDGRSRSAAVGSGRDAKCSAT